MLLSSRQFFVRESVSFLKLANTYEIFDPQTNLQLGIARDEPSGWTRLARFLGASNALPTMVRVYEREASPPVLSLQKLSAMEGNRVILIDAQGAHFGSFANKAKLIGEGFLVLDKDGNQFAAIEGDWTAWNFRVLDMRGRELGLVTRKWDGIASALFTNADNYLISVSEVAASVANSSALMLAAGLAIDLFFGEW